MKQHVIKVAATCHYHLRRLRQICRCVGREVTIRIVLALVMSRIDYCNSAGRFAAVVERATPRADTSNAAATAAAMAEWRTQRQVYCDLHNQKRESFLHLMTSVLIRFTSFSRQRWRPRPSHQNSNCLMISVHWPSTMIRASSTNFLTNSVRVIHFPLGC